MRLGCVEPLFNIKPVLQAGEETLEETRVCPPWGAKECLHRALLQDTPNLRLGQSARPPCMLLLLQRRMNINSERWLSAEPQGFSLGCFGEVLKEVRSSRTSIICTGLK